MNNIPIITIQLDSIKEQVAMMFNDRADIFKDFIATALEEKLSEKSIKEQVSIQVGKCVDDAILTLNQNHELRQFVQKLVIDEITSKKNVGR